MQKVSVVIPVYNRPELLNEALKSIFQQTYENYEIVVVDDASSDNLRNLVPMLSNPKVVYHRLEKNVGCINARNAGIQMASGDFLAFLDSDDIMSNTKLEKLMNEALRSGANFVYAGWIWKNFDTGKIRIKRIPDKNGLIDGLPRWCYNIVPDLVKSEIIKEIPFSASLAANNENTELLIKIWPKLKTSFVEDVLSEFRDHFGKRESDKTEAILKGMEYIMNSHFDFVRSQKNWTANKFLSMALLAKSINKPRSYYHSLFFKAWKLNPFDIKISSHWLRSII